ncbi:MAG: holo-ACP synthase [Lachnospiraceae bacterium]|nr:holo-ACP synthase [Lachnospiraceae bacterium]
MSIVGIGTDLVEIDRMQKAYEKKAFRKRVFTDKEQELICESVQRAAGNFAVKESVAKMFGTGFLHFNPIDIEVLRDEKGCPYVVLYDGALQLATDRKINKIHVSITNTKVYASAFVVGENVEKADL